jgi:hypothetical protein
MKVFILIHTCCNFTSMFQSMFSSKIICLLVIECLYFLLSQLKRSLDYQNAVFAGCRARTPDPPARAREDSPPRGARGGCRVRRRDTSVTRPMRADIRVGAEPAKRRVSAFRRVRGKRNAGISRGAMHGQGQKRRRRDARAGSEAPKARCTGRVRSASAHLVVNVVFDEVLSELLCSIRVRPLLFCLVLTVCLCDRGHQQNNQNQIFHRKSH